MLKIDFGRNPIDIGPASFVTDSNGMEPMQRVFKPEDSLEKNFYPVVSYMTVKTAQGGYASLITDRGIGVTS